MKKTLCLLLALFTTLTAFSACGSETETTAQATTTEKTEVTTEAETIAEEYRDDLDPTYTFGSTYTILSRASTKAEFESESGLSADAVEAAVYKRNEAVMERAGVTIEITSINGDWEQRETFSGVVRNNSMADTSEFSIIATHSSYLANLTLEGICSDFNDFEDINLNKRWWSEYYAEEASYKGAVYMMVGDLAYTLYEYMEVVFFNEQMAENLGLEDLYDLALDGDWTYAKLKEYTLRVTSDPEAGENQLYGLLTNCHAERALPSCMNINLASRDATTEQYTFSRSMDETASNRFDELMDFILNNEGVLSPKNYGTSADTETPMFIGSRALFYTQTLDEAATLRKEMEDDYGILPFPKYDEDQVDYKTNFRDTMTAIIIPTNITNKKMVGVVTEMLSMESYNTVTQAYYEKVLKYQSFNDPRCVDILEVIRNCCYLNFLQIYSNCISNTNSFFSGLIYEGGTTSASTQYATLRTVWNQKLIEVYESLDKILAD